MEKTERENMEKDVIISVIVAVYNAEKYLRQCLDSILSQQLEEIEILCVDDASTDCSADILDEYKKKDKRITIITHDENKGIARTRNDALKIARGKYIAFVDSDDFISDDALYKVKRCFDTDEEIDSVLFRVCICKEDETYISDYPMTPFNVIPGEKAFIESLDWNIHGWYVVKADIHKRFPYDETSRTYSDDNTTRLHYMSSRKVGYCDGIYYYRQHPNSVTHVISNSRYDFLDANTSMSNTLEKMNVSEDIRAKYEQIRWCNVCGMYMFYVRHRQSFSKYENKDALKRIFSAWQKVRLQLVPSKTKLKFGYIPFRTHYLPSKLSWNLYRLQEEIYFFLRRLKYGKEMKVIEN